MTTPDLLEASTHADVEPAFYLRGVSYLYSGRQPALDGVDLDIAFGERIALLGANGSGKSTLLKCICGVLQPTSGEVAVRGKLAALLELGAGFQQDLTGRENIYLNGSLLGMSKREVDRAFEWLESAYQHHDAGLSYLKYDPLLRKVRADARYAALLKKMNLPAD